jgi:tetratricopeptide (TPR) repeat protein
LVAQFTANGDDLGLAKAHFVAMGSSWTAAKAVPAGEQLKLVARHARRAGDDGLRLQALAIYTSSLVYGPTHVRALIQELDALEHERESSYLRAYIEGGRSEAARLEARFDDARVCARRAIETNGAMSKHMEAFGWTPLAHAEQSAGNLEAALVAFEKADAGHAAAGREGFRCTVQAKIAEVRTALGDHAAAREALELSERIASPDDEANAAITLRVRSQLALAEAELEPAEDWARRAVAKGFESDFPEMRGDARLQLAKVHAASGRPEEAAAEAREALAIHEAKGDRPGMAQAQAFLKVLTATS